MCQISKYQITTQEPDLNSITTMQIPFTLVPIRNIYGLAERLVPGLSGKIELKVGLLMSLVGK